MVPKNQDIKKRHLFLAKEKFNMEKAFTIEALYHNIKHHYIFSFLQSFHLTRGIWMIYLYEKGLNLFQIGLMETLYHLSSFCFEVPTGAVADLWGRKKSRILGRSINAIGILLMLKATHIGVIGISFILQALANTLESGAGDALIYDSLKLGHKEEKYVKMKGIEEIIFQVVGLISLVLGGYIAGFGYDKVYQMALLLALITFFQSFFFIEPPIGTDGAEKKKYKGLKHQIIESFHLLKKDRETLFWILFLELFSAFYVTEFFYGQNLFHQKGWSPFHIGLVLAAGSLFAVLLALLSPKIEKTKHRRGLFLFFSFIAIASFTAMAVKGWEHYAMVLLCGIDSLLVILMTAEIQRRLPSDKRATLLSIESMVFSVFMMIIFPIAGKLGDWKGLNRAFGVLAIMFVMAFGLLAVWMYWHRGGKNHDRNQRSKFK